MIDRLVFLLVFALLNSYLFGKKYKVAWIANSVLFIFLFTLNIFVVDHAPLVRFWVNLMGERYYFPIRDALYFATNICNISTGLLIVLQSIFFVFIPVVSVVTLVREIREEVEKIRANNVIILNNMSLDYDDSVKKEYIRNENNIRLKYGVMQN